MSRRDLLTRDRPDSTRCLTCRAVRECLRISLIALLLLLPSVRAIEPQPDTVPFRMGFSKRLFSDVNINDARAALKAWALTVAQERNIPADPDVSVPESVGEIEQALADRRLDGLGLTADEYASLSTRFHFDPVLMPILSGRTNVEYLVLVHRQSGIENLEALRGRTVAFCPTPRTSLALFWFDLRCFELGAEPAAVFVGQLSSVNKVSAAVLPVFFRRLDACLVDRSGFDTMSELNPQVGQQLRAVAVSAPLVPALLCLRADYPPAMKARIASALEDLHHSPAGQQVLTAFQMGRFVRASETCLASSLELLEKHRRLLGSPTNVPAQPGTVAQQVRSSAK